MAEPIAGPSSKEKRAQPREIGVLRKLWFGLYPLPIAFWIFYVLGFFGLVFFSGVMLFSLSSFKLRPVGFLLGICILFPYMFVASVGVWRSAGVHIASPIGMGRLWGVAARALVGFYAVGFVWRLLNGGALALMNMITGHGPP